MVTCHGTPGPEDTTDDDVRVQLVESASDGSEDDERSRVIVSQQRPSQGDIVIRLPSRTRYSTRRKKKRETDEIEHDHQEYAPEQDGDIQLQTLDKVYTEGRQMLRSRSLRGTLRQRSQKSVRRDAIGNNLTIDQRRTLRRKELDQMEKFEVKKLPLCTRIGYEFSLGIQRGWTKVKEGFSTFHIWSDPIKEIEGNLGSGVTTYFRVLRWLLKINILNLVFAMALITGPGVLIKQGLDNTNYNHTYNADDLKCTNPDFLNVTTSKFNQYVNYVLQFLTGTGWVEKTPLYIGWYPSHNITTNKKVLENSGCSYESDTYDCYLYDSTAISSKTAVSRSNASTQNIKCDISCKSKETTCDIACNNTVTQQLKDKKYVCPGVPTVMTYGSRDCQFQDVVPGVGLKCENCFKPEVTYNFGLAYVLVGLCYFAVSLLWVSRNIMKLFKKSAVETLEYKAYSQLVLGGWDYNIKNKQSAILKSKSIFKSLKEELMSDEQKEKKLTTQQKIVLLFLRLLTNLLCIGAMGATIYMYYYVSVKANSSMCKEKSAFDISNIKAEELFERFKDSYAPSVIVSVSNIIFPVFFELIGNFERYQFQSTRINITLARSFIMKLFSIISYLYILYGNIAYTAYPSTTLTKRDTFKFNCWEDFLGSELFRLCIIDFFIFCFALFLSEYVRRIVVDHSRYFKRTFDISEFNISKDVLDLAYKQMIFWSALFFCPLISVAAVLEIVLMFYMKKISALRNVKPPEKVILNSSSSSIINAVFIVSLMVVFIPVGFFVFTFKPSKLCGPFQNLDSFIDPINVVIVKSGKFKTLLLDNLKMTSVAVVLVVVTLIVLYYFYSLAASRNITIQLLRHQIKSENQDKKFLIEQIKSGMISVRGGDREQETPLIEKDNIVKITVKSPTPSDVSRVQNTLVWYTSGKKRKIHPTSKEAPDKKKKRGVGTYANPNVRREK